MTLFDLEQKYGSDSHYAIRTGPDAFYYSDFLTNSAILSSTILIYFRFNLSVSKLLSINSRNFSSKHIYLSRILLARGPITPILSANLSKSKRHGCPVCTVTLVSAQFFGLSAFERLRDRLGDEKPLMPALFSLCLLF